MNKWTDFMFSENSPEHYISASYEIFFFLSAYLQKRFEVTYNKKVKNVVQAVKEEIELWCMTFFLIQGLDIVGDQ